MKFVKLIRPLFLVALGLHGLALFLPIGGDAETAEVEVADETVLAERSPTSEKLPVPDLNVAADGAVPVPTSDAFSSILSPSATKQVAPATTRSTQSAVAVPGATATRAMPTGNPSRSAGSPPSAAPATSPAPAADSSPPLAPLDISATSDRPDNALPDNSTTTDTPASDSSTEVAEPDRGLITSAIQQLPDSLKALMNRWAIALTYNPRGTDDRSAKTAESKWMDKINAQASGVGVGRLEPEILENFAQVSYPIEASVRDREQSFRICLDQPPSLANVGVLFDSQGVIAGEPELIRSTGYKAINEEAIATVKTAQNLPEDRLSKAFIFEVGVDYDPESCVKLSGLKS